MKKQFIFFILLNVSLMGFSQVEFKQGYFIDNSGKKTECFIKNMDWKNNPSSFKYKLPNNEEIMTGDIAGVKEFCIINESKYIRDSVKIDRSSNNIPTMSKVRNPVYSDEVLFLKLLVEGKANLYSYEQKSLKRFFYKLDNKKSEQLIYKSFLQKDNTVGKNQDFKQQLLENFVCSSINLKNIELLEYEVNDLVDFFLKYNECNNSESISYKKNQNPFHIGLKVGMRHTSVYVPQSISLTKDLDFNYRNGIFLASEIEYIMPFNKNKWSIIFEPSYQTFVAENSDTTLLANFDYKSIDLSFGVRYKFFLSTNSLIFINNILTYSLPFKNSGIFFSDQTIVPIYIDYAVSYTPGIGYTYKNRLSFQFNYEFQRRLELARDFEFWSADYKSYYLTIGYRIF